MVRVRLILVLLVFCSHVGLRAQVSDPEVNSPLVIELTEPPCVLEADGSLPEGWDTKRIARADGLYFSGQRMTVRGLIEKLRQSKTKGAEFTILVSPFVPFKRVIQVSHALMGASLELEPTTWATTRKPTKRFPIIFAASQANLKLRLVDGKLVFEGGADLDLGEELMASLKKFVEKQEKEQKTWVSLTWKSSDEGPFEQLLWRLNEADLTEKSSKKKYVLLEETLVAKMDKDGAATLAFAPDLNVFCGHVMKAYEVAEKAGALPTVITNATPSMGRVFSRVSVGPRWVPRSIERTLAVLASTQGDHGSWTTKLDGDISNLGATSLALLSFLGEFHTPEEGKYKEAVAAGVRYLLSKQQRNGSLAQDVSGFSLDHVLGTFALIELGGQTDDDEHNEAASKALKFLLRCRNKEGVWGRSGPQSKSDLVVTAWVCLVLQSADDCDLDLPEDIKTRANSWVDSIMDEKTGHIPLVSEGKRLTTVKGVANEFIGRHDSSLTSLGLVVKNFCGKTMADDSRVTAAVNEVARALPGIDPALGPPDLDYLHFGARAINQFGGSYWQAWRGNLNSAVDAYFTGSRGEEPGAGRSVIGKIDPVELSILSLSLELSYRYALSHKDD